MPMLLPPPQDIRPIAGFLMHFDRRVNRLIGSKRRLIGLLEEQKQGIIHSVITHGLDSSVALKSSGVKWLGDVPAHWDIVALGRLLENVEQGWSPVAAEGDFADDQWGVLTLSAVKRGTFKASAIKPISRAADVPTRLEVRVGDFLLTRSNTRERVGDVCIVDAVRPRTILCDLIYRLTIHGNAIDKKLLMFQFLGPLGRGQIERAAQGASGTMPKIAQKHIKSWRILVPPIPEQKAMVDSIEKRLAPIVSTMEQAERQILLLREYRTRLIADVVTGQLDVRGVSLPPLPDSDADDPEADLDDADDADLLEAAEALDEE
ncbi:hypothetical protein [uncultured Thiodictyon sp.]|jgi:type I restriction enzyme S subunit|uniref:restriction endonuclease subunit S n=1 Tax=uncultured Thiodictyon sp. TaxID=1846217 RepID=UPI0025E2ADB1|nr:hypothetical protein [uncultured Thiodictyon sp.]